jgi:hypothetical protein
MLLSPEQTVQVVLPAKETVELRDYLGERLGPLWTPRWLKSPKKKPTEYHKKRRPPNGSICVHRALQAEKRRQARERRRGRRRSIRSPT